MLNELFKDSGLPGFKFVGDKANLGSVVSSALVVIYFLVTFVAFFYLIWGAVQYITASGEKDKLAHARSRIIWAIIGLLFIFASLLIAQYAQQILQPRGGSPLQ